MTWTNFKRVEFRCKCGCKKNLIKQDFVDRLQRLRDRYARPMVITSGYRCPDHNITCSGTGTGPHTTGHAADILVSGRNTFDLVRYAIDAGFTGIGLMQHGPHNSRFIHLDDIKGGHLTRPTIWTYGG